MIYQLEAEHCKHQSDFVRKKKGEKCHEAPMNG
jgi:hypothetical protein